MEKKQHNIDLARCFAILCQRKKVYFKVLPIVFILSCIWIFPQPRYYRSSVALAPEYASENAAGGLSSLASSFGFNLGALGGSSDAIYPLLYPELFQSPEFIVSLYDIKVKSLDGAIDTDYYTYMKKHQLSNPLTAPFRAAKRWVVSLFKEKQKGGPLSAKEVNPFMMSERDFLLMEIVQKKILCTIDKKTEVITITVTDQDPMIAATMTDSVCARLQDFIVMYRTSKARMDAQYYQTLVDSARKEFDKVSLEYSKFCDSHNSAIRQSVISQRERLETDRALKLNAYTALSTQLETMKAKIQENTPAFTVLQSATVAPKPAGPKRMLFVIGMCLLASIVITFWLVRKEIFGIGTK
ncbi:MAG: chain-length determining protein [Bacteroidaceae bacterium]|jgi:uncharacterized protein involved in exopolysaccharide biosynthesis|nr:chain-length determining protein [Bacteroidaceae bacterium]